MASQQSDDLSPELLERIKKALDESEADDGKDLDPEVLKKITEALYNDLKNTTNLITL